MTTKRKSKQIYNIKYSDYVSFGNCPSGIVRMISESPGSMIDNVLTLKYLPQAVPRELLSPE